MELAVSKNRKICTNLFWKANFNSAIASLKFRPSFIIYKSANQGIANLQGNILKSLGNRYGLRTWIE
jgi:hypothetical protein